MGRLFRRYFTAKDGVKKMNPKWYADFQDGNGIRKQIPLCANKVAALAMLSELEKKADRQKAGLSDRFEEWRKTPLLQHLADWGQTLRGQADGGQMILARVKRLVAESGAVFIQDIVPSRMMEALARLTKSHTLSATSTGHYLGGIKQFTRWLEIDGRTEANPIKHLKKPPARFSLVHERRAFTQAEIAWLFQTTQGASTLGGITGGDRVWLYRLALTTGLRAKELWSLTPASFNQGFVTIEAGNAKNKREESLPIPDSLKADLLGWLSTKKPGVQIFGRLGRPLASGRVDTCPASKHLKKDMLDGRQSWLADGGDPTSGFLLWEDASGQFADFHALRATGITWAVEGGANPKTVQAFARHSTITLTMDRYCKPKRHDLVSLSNNLGGKLWDHSQKGEIIVTPIVTKLSQKGDIPKTRLISIEQTTVPGVASKPSGKQAFLTVSPAKTAMNALGIEPRTYGLKVRCSTS